MKKFILYISTLSLLMMTGCDNYLDTVPDNRTEINTPEKISELLVTAYPQASYVPFCELMSDNVSDKFEGRSPSPIYSKPYFWEDVLQNDTDAPTYYWGACYAAIAASNQALASIKALGDGASLNPQKGEALVARAYAHFMLVNLFSKFYDATTAATDLGIPYVTEVETIVNKQYDRKTVAYVYDMIEKDLTEGLPLIKDQVYKVPAYHFTQMAANAFASRFYLYKKNYDKVIAHADKVAGSGGFPANMRNWNTNYSTKSYTNISTEYSKSTEKANLLLAETNSAWARYFASSRYGLSNSLKEDLYYTPSPSGGYWGYSVFGGQDYSNIPKYNEYFVRTSQSSNVGNVYNMIPLFTTEEVLFNRAEAYLYKGNATGCLADLNTFLSLRIVKELFKSGGYDPALHTLTTAKNNAWYGTTNTGGALLQTIINFRQMEFMHEGLRWFDLLRYKIPVTHNNQDGTSQTLAADDKRKVLQIPQESILAGMPLNPR